jgi:hypothetical protein
VLRQPFVHEGVVGAIEVEHIAIAAHEIVEEDLGLAAHGAAQLLVEVRILADVRLHDVEVRQPQPLRGKARRERAGPRVGEHAAHFALEPGRLRQRSTLGGGEERTVGRGRPEEEREARGQVDVAQAIRLARRCICRGTFEAEDEVGRGEEPLQRAAHTGLEATVGAGGVVQRHQAAAIFVAKRATIGLGRKARDD